MDPQYQELLAKDVPHVKKDGVFVKVIAGESLGVTAAGNSNTELCSNPNSNPMNTNSNWILALTVALTEHWL